MASEISVNTDSGNGQEKRQNGQGKVRELCEILWLDTLRRNIKISHIRNS